VFSTKILIRTAFFTALIAIVSLIGRFSAGLVPFSLMPFMVLISGFWLPPKAVALAFSAYILLGLIGLPVFASPPFGGPSYLLQPTFGFLPGFLLAGIFVSWGCRKFVINNFLKSLGLSFLGVLIIYIPGLLYLWWALNFIVGSEIGWVGVLQVGFWPFLGFDLFKAILGAIIFLQIKSRIPDIRK